MKVNESNQHGSTGISTGTVTLGGCKRGINSCLSLSADDTKLLRIIRSDKNCRFAKRPIYNT